MKYYVVKKQNPACDYSICCGTSIKELNSKSMQDAIQEVIGLPKNWESLLNEISEDEDEDAAYDALHDLLADATFDEITDKYPIKIATF
jgi:hypothetical protein